MILTELFARLGLQTDAASFAKGQLAVEGLKLGLLAVAGMAERATRAIAGSVSKVVEQADAFDEAAQKTGIQVEALQELTYAAGFSSINMQTLVQTMGIFGKNAEAARGGSEDMAKSFHKAGVTMEDVRTKSPDELLMQLADNFKAMAAGSDKSTLAMSLFGKSGKDLIPFLNEGAAGIGKLRQQARDMGIVMNEAGIAAGVKAADSFGVLKGALTGLMNTAIVPLLPAIAEGAAMFSEWIQKNRADIVLLIGTAVKLLGLAFKGLLFFLKPLMSVLAFLVKHFKLIAIILGGALAAALIADASLFYALGASAIQAGFAMVAAAARSAAAWIVAAAPFLVILAVLGLIFLIVEDIMAGMEGKKSVFGLIFNWIDKIPKIIATWFTETIKQWKIDIIEFFNWLLDGIRAIPGKIKEGVKGLFDRGWLGDVVSVLPGGGAIAPFIKGAENAHPLFPGGAPTVPTPQRGGVTIHAPLNVTIGPGVDPSSVATPFQKMLDEWWVGKTGEIAGASGVR